MFIHLSKLPPSFITAREFSRQSKRNVKHARNCDKDKLEKGPCELSCSADILPVRPFIVNDLVENVLAFGTRHEL